MSWLAPVLPLGILALAGVLLGRGLFYGRGIRSVATLLAIILFVNVTLLGPFVTGAGGIFGQVAEFLSFTFVLIGSWIAAGAVAIIAAPRRWIPLTIACGVPFLFWAVTAVRDTVPQDLATLCAVESMAISLEQTARERGGYPTTLEDPAVQKAYQATFEALSQNGCLRDPVPRWLKPFGSADYRSHLATNGWRYQQNDGAYDLAFAYRPRKLGWFVERICSYNSAQHQAHCTVMW